MRLKLTITGYYSLPDDPVARLRAYGTEDVAACCDMDRENAEADPAMFLDGLMNDVAVTVTAPDPEGSTP